MPTLFSTISAGVVCAIALLCPFPAVQMPISNSVSPRPSRSTDPLKTAVVCTEPNSQISLPIQSSQECPEKEFAEFGKPLMFPVHDGIAYGVSSESEKPYNLHYDVQYSMCCGLAFYALIDVYNSEGRRVPSWEELRDKEIRDGGGSPVMVCSCSFLLIVHPHTMQAVDGGDIRDSYALPSGSYTIRERPLPRPDGTASNRNSERPRTFISRPGPGLAIEIP